MKDQAEAISKWLQDCASVLSGDSKALQSFIRAARNDTYLFSGLFELFSESGESTKSFTEHLTALYQANDVEARVFTLEFVPALIHAYLNSVYLEPSACHNALSTCILSLFNATLALPSAENDIRAANLSRSSIYHEADGNTNMQLSGSLPRTPSSNSPIAALAAGLLNSFAAGSVGIETPQNLPVSVHHSGFVTSNGAATSPALRISAELRYPILTRLLIAYNHHVSFVSATSLSAACCLCESVCAMDCITPGSSSSTSSSTTDGTPMHTHPNDQAINLAPRRIPLDHFFVTQLVLAVSHALWNGMYGEAESAIAVAEKRAAHELFCDVLLLTDAVRNGGQAATRSNALELHVPPIGRLHPDVASRNVSRPHVIYTDNGVSSSSASNRPTTNATIAGVKDLPPPTSTSTSASPSPAASSFATVTVTLSSTCTPR